MKQAFCAFILLAASLGSPAMANVDPSGPKHRLQVTQLLLDKSSRTLYLLSGRKAVRSYSVDLGPNPAGHKQHQGDGRTPEGLYYITHRNPGSNFFLSLGISYPNAQDRARARALGRDPGGDIFIHGRSPACRTRHAIGRGAAPPLLTVRWPRFSPWCSLVHLSSSHKG